MPAHARWVVGFVVFLLIAVGVPRAATPQDAPEVQGTVVYIVSGPVTNPSGPAVYYDRCAVCHGGTGNGDGRAMHYLTVPVPDLTRIALRDGKFDSSHVFTHIQHLQSNRPMPCWGRVLRTAGNEPIGTTLIISNLTDYLKSIQVSQ